MLQAIRTEQVEAYRRRPDRSAVDDNPGLAWADPLDALRWAYNTVGRGGRYAKTGLVPPSPGRMPWDEIEDLALTITGRAHQIPDPGGPVLRAACAGPAGDLSAFQRTIEVLAEGVTRDCGEACEISLPTRESMATVAVLRLTHATAHPLSRRHPPFWWYAKAADVSRETIYRRRWRAITASFEELAVGWRDLGATFLREDLEALGALR